MTTRTTTTPQQPTFEPEEPSEPPHETIPFWILLLDLAALIGMAVLFWHVLDLLF